MVVDVVDVSVRVVVEWCLLLCEDAVVDDELESKRRGGLGVYIHDLDCSVLPMIFS